MINVEFSSCINIEGKENEERKFHSPAVVRINS
jgi:hypothetical protein